jgi:hypothetical protein
MSLCSLWMIRWRVGTLFASCTAMLVTNFLAWLTSPLSREKKKLAPRRFCSKYLPATVRAIVDFSVPAKPFSQKIRCSSCSSAQSYISRRSSTLVDVSVRSPAITILTFAYWRRCAMCKAFKSGNRVFTIGLEVPVNVSASGRAHCWVYIPCASPTMPTCPILYATQIIAN